MRLYVYLSVHRRVTGSALSPQNLCEIRYRMSSTRESSEHIISARETLDSEHRTMISRIDIDISLILSTALFDISQLLNTRLDKETLATCVQMIESGVNPQALAVRNRFSVSCFPHTHCTAFMRFQAVIQELRRESATLQSS